jgi:hypothetical protein
LEERAHRRIERPFGCRRAEAGALSGRTPQPAAATPRHLRIRVQKPLAGMKQPLAAAHIRALLETLGPESAYGLRSVTCCQRSAVTADSIVFGEYVPPGDIILYSLPALPWRLAFLLHAEHIALFEAYGARVHANPVSGQTRVDWTSVGLTRFALYEVLAHELGHHRLQYGKGKRSAPAARRADHELRADLYSMRARRVEAIGSAER